MLEKGFKKYIGETILISDFVLGIVVVGIMVIGVLVVTSIILQETKGDSNMYNRCIMEAISKLDRSADVISLCKELK